VVSVARHINFLHKILVLMFGTEIAMSHGVRDQVAGSVCLTNGCSELKRFLGEGLKIPPIRGVSPAEQVLRGVSHPKRTILEASDWLLGAEGHLPGRGVAHWLSLGSLSIRPVSTLILLFLTHQAQRVLFVVALPVGQA
jgi:hypothetical protein